jgi:glycosyltransferase involved in cell wall biosynthesis
MNPIDFKSKFEWKSYIGRYHDLKNCPSLELAWNHANNFGWKENRTIFSDDNIQKAFVSFKKTGVMPVENTFLSQKNKKILVNIHSNLNITAGDTIMISNIMNIMMKNGNHITLLTEFDCVDILKKNLEMTQYTIVKQNSNELISYMNTNHSKFDTIFVRNHNILTGLVNKSYLNKTILYGLDVHLESIVKMNNQFRSLVTQSEQLKNLYIKKGILGKKIEILEPISMKYDFKLPERNDNEIRMIYCGTLRDEENILEIIEEFQKIHKERPEVVLKIVYGKIHGDDIFKKKVNEYIKNGIKGINFKHNLSHKDACYEIATSDIGICWRKNGWGDNGEVSTKVKEYEMYNIKLLTNNYNINVDTNILYFQNSFAQILSNYNNKTLINGNYTILYMTNTSLPQISGYTVRTKHILNEINKYYKIICFVKPNNKNKYTNIYNIDGIIYYHYNDISTYQNYIINYINYNKTIKFIWSASDNYNGIISGTIGKIINIKSIYELRGLWHYTRKYKETCENNFDEKFFNNYDGKEKLSCELNNYILCENENILNICKKQYNIDENKLSLLKNGVVNFEKKKYIKKNRITFGYIGSIVSYEGLENLINIFKEINHNNYDTELLIIGGGITFDAIKTIKNIKNLIKDTENIKYLGMVPHEEIDKYYDKIDVICLPRINCEVCNIVAPLKPYEGMMNGKIIFASSVDAISEIITHNYNGILFDKEDINDLKNKMIDILTSKYDFNKIIQNGYEYCEKHTWEQTCKNALKIINSNM